MEKVYINHLAVFVCALLSLVVGALWYSPVLFFKAWQKETGLSDEQVAKANPLKTYSLTLVLAWIISYTLLSFSETARQIGNGVWRPDSSPA